MIADCGLRIADRGAGPGGLGRVDGCVRVGEDLGFTLIEVMAALMILGTSLLVLLDAHYNALGLHDTTGESVLMNELVALALGAAESEVQAGNLEGASDFGERHEGYAFSFRADQLEETEGVTLFLVTVMVTGPGDDRSMEMMVYGLGAAGADGYSGAS